jgi:hypothetical protein
MDEDPADLRFRLALGLIGLGAIAAFLLGSAALGRNGFLAFEAVGFGGAFSAFLTWDSWRRLRRHRDGGR